MSASWCDQLNEVVNKLTRKLFLAKFRLWEFSVCITGVICFTFVYTSLLVISWFWRNSYMGVFCFGHPPVFWYFSAISYYLFLRDGQTLNWFSNYYYLSCVPGLLMCVLLCSPQLHSFVLMLLWSVSKLFMSSPHCFMYKDTKNSVSVKWKSKVLNTTRYEAWKLILQHLKSVMVKFFVYCNLWNAEF